MLRKQFLIAIIVNLLTQLTQQNPISLSLSVDYYSDCGHKVNCFGLGAKDSTDKTECLRNKNCIVLLKTQSSDTGAKFELFWSRNDTSSDSWVGVGLSVDSKLGDDFMTEYTISKTNSVGLVNGMTYCDHGVDICKFQPGSFGQTNVEDKGLSDVKTSYSSGLLTAQWSRSTHTYVGLYDYDIHANKYYILLAYGPIDDPVIINRYSDLYFSSNAVILNGESLQTDPYMSTETDIVTLPSTTTTIVTLILSTLTTILPSTTTTLSITTEAPVVTSSSTLLTSSTSSPQTLSEATVQSTITSGKPLLTTTVDENYKFKQRLITRVDEIDIRIKNDLRIFNDNQYKNLVKSLVKEQAKIDKLAKELEEVDFILEVMIIFENKLDLIEQKITNSLRIFENSSSAQLKGVDQVLGEANKIRGLINDEVKKLYEIDNVHADIDALRLISYQDKIEEFMDSLIESQNDNELKNNENELKFYLTIVKDDLDNVIVIYTTSKPQLKIKKINYKD